MNKEIYPGEKCGLTEDEWNIKLVIDRIKELTTLEGIGILRKFISPYAIELCRSAHSDGWTKQLTTTDSWHNPSWLEFKEKHGL